MRTSMGNLVAVSIVLAVGSFAGATMQITEYMYQGAPADQSGEFVEFTNVGGPAVNMIGWSFDDNTRQSGSQDLSAYGTIAPGESVILPDITAADFRTRRHLDDSVKVILMEVPKEHPFVQVELMMPILPLVRVNDVDEAIAVAIEVEHGNRHTAMMHSTNVCKLTKMAKLIQTTIFVKNGPSYAGIGVGGEGYATFTIAGPTGEGLTSAKSFARRRKCVMVEALNIR